VGTLEAGEGAKMHRHDNIDNIVFLRTGALLHRDDHGHGGLLQAGEAHLLAAGESIQHEETVHGSETVHAVVIWIRPERRGGPSHYYQWKPSQAVRREGWSLVASGRPHPAGRALALRCDAELLSVKLKADEHLGYRVETGRRAYLLVLEGELLVNETPVSTGERVLVETSGDLDLVANSGAELLLIDLAAP
jgi:redox-sensitive bicupin YhaK (pirin superfamily)